MFTGIVEQTGKLAQKRVNGPGARFSIDCTFGHEAPFVIGESIAVEGVCLSVIAATRDRFEVDASAETLARTTLGTMAEGAAVNLERALRVGDRLGGHMVSGHVDGVGITRRIETIGDAWSVTFDAPDELARFIAEKGSITINGASLTVNRVAGVSFDVMLIPITRRVTTLRDLSTGSRVNLEIDVVARYVARLLELPPTSPTENAKETERAWTERLGNAGFLIKR